MLVPPSNGCSTDKRKLLPPISTHLLGASTPETQSQLLRSASDAVADVLGVDSSELPQPFQGLTLSEPSADTLSSLYDSYFSLSSSVYSTPLDMDWSWQNSLVQEHITRGVASVLGLEMSDIFRGDSFTELGGNQQAAEKLSADCKAAGLSVEPDDILACPTIAELETMVTPLTTARTDTTSFSTSPIVSPLSSAFGAHMSELAAAMADQPPLVPLKAPRRVSRLMQRRQSKLINKPKTKRGPPSTGYEQVEHVLCLDSAVSRAVVIRPRAGPFEGRMVACLSLAGYSARSPSSCEISLEDPYDASHLRSAKRAVEKGIHPTHRPEVWVVLRQIPRNSSGDFDRRKVQTWIQNANEDMHNRIMSANREEVVSRGASSTEFTSAVSSETASWAGRGDEKELFDLSPMQRLYFHTPMGNGATRSHTEEYRFNQSLLLRLKKHATVEDLHAAIEAIVGHHSMLRCRFQRVENSWCQWIEPEIPSSYQFWTHSVASTDELEAIISFAQGSINIEQGPVFSAHHFRAPDGHEMIYLLAHRLVVDLKSWPVIAKDLDELLGSGCLTSSPSLSYPNWISQQTQHAQTLGALDNPDLEIPIPNKEFWGVQEHHNTYENTIKGGFTLGAELLSALEGDEKLTTGDCPDLFIAALLLSFSRAFPDRPVPTLWNQEHGRADLHSRGSTFDTVGWFTSLRPLALDIAPLDDISKVLTDTIGLRRSVAEKSVPYLTTSLMDAQSAASFVSAYCPMELTFMFARDGNDINSEHEFLEQISVPGRAPWSGTSDIGPEVGRISTFEVSAFIDQGAAEFRFLYHQDTLHKNQIQQWIRGFESLLRETLDQLRNPPPDLSPIDLPFMEATPEGFARLNQEILPALGLESDKVAGIYPATESQQSILINESLIPGSSHAQVTYELDTGDNSLDTSRICAAWQQVSDKHPALRTIFIQSISKSGLYDRLVLRHHSPAMLFFESERGHRAIQTVDNVPPVSWSESAPCHRLIVCQSPGTTLLKLEISHAICDNTSLFVLFRELREAYLNGYSPISPRISQHEYLDYLNSAPSATPFWKNQLDGCQPCLLPTLSTQDSSNRRWSSTVIDLPISREYLTASAARHNVDMPTMLRVAWALVLRIYAGVDDVCFGYQTSGRDIPVSGVKEAVGYFSSTLVCRLQVPAARSILSILRTAEQKHAEALNHQIAANSDIQYQLGIRSQRMFNTCMSFGRMDVATELASSDGFRHVKSKFCSEYDLFIDINISSGTVSLDIGQRIFDATQATAIAHSFGRAIQTIMEDPEYLVKQADLFSQYDHEQILAWNSMAKPDVCDQPIHELIAQQASENPDKQAVCAWDGDFTYSELYRHSMALAGHLTVSGLEPQTLVPVIVDKSRWALVAMVAVLLADAVLIPVDAEAKPLASWIIKAVGATFVLASDSARRGIDNAHLDLVLVNEYTVSAMSPRGALVNNIKSKSTNLACILFEHASLKTKKGIAYDHRSLATALLSQAPALRIYPSSRVMQLSSYNVDVSLTEIFVTLLSGGCVCIPSASERLVHLAEAAQRMNVNWTYLTPTLSRKLRPEKLPNIDVVCFRAPHLDADTYMSWAGKAQVLLTYGPREVCPLGISVVEIKDVNAIHRIGRPFYGNFWVVSPDDSNRLMPVGAIGELLFGSPTRTTGVGLKEVAVEKWSARIPAEDDSKLAASDTRLVKTGQLARYRENGLVEFATPGGDADPARCSPNQQSEIELLLRQCLGQGVDVAVETVSFKDGRHSPVIAAFVELGDGLRPSEADLLNLSHVSKERLRLVKQSSDMALRGSLPAHLIPSAYVPVNQLPLSPSLEVDRRALHKLVAEFSHGQILSLTGNTGPPRIQELRANPLPFTEAENQLRKIWADVLGLSKASVETSDRFLNRGGDSALARKLVISCRENQIILHIVDVLRNLTLSELSRRAVFLGQPAQNKGVAKQPAPADAPVKSASLSRDIESMKEQFDDVAEASSLQTLAVEAGSLQGNGDVSYFIINMSGLIDRYKLEKACFDLANSHPILRTGFEPCGQRLLQVVFRPQSFRPAFRRYRCPGQRLDEVVAGLIERDQLRPVDFRKPVTKFIFVDGGGTSTLVMRLSRAQYSETTLSLLLRDLGRIHDDPDNAERRPGLCDVVRAARNANVSNASRYWCQLLEGSAMTCVLSQSAPPIPTWESTTVTQQIPVSVVQSLGFPFEVILKGAWSIVLSKLSGADDVVFGHYLETRDVRLANDRSSRNVVGPLGNIIPVRTKHLGMSVSPYEYLTSIQTQHNTSISHGGMEFMNIMRDCTSWPAWTRFATVVQHMDQPEHGPLEEFSLGPANCKLSRVEANHQHADILVRSVASSDTTIDMALTVRDGRVPLSFAGEVMELLYATIALLTSTPARSPFSLELLDGYTMSRIPLPSPPQQDIHTTRPAQPIRPDQARAISSLVQEAWDSILGSRPVSPPKQRTTIPFYKIWGSLVPAAELARYFTEHLPDLKIPNFQGVKFSAEEIVSHPSMADQYELIVSKKQTLQSRFHLQSPVRGVNDQDTQAPPIATSLSPWLIRRRETGDDSGSSTAHQQPISRFSDSSMDSMTSGSSRSDQDELREVAKPGKSTALSRIKPKQLLSLASVKSSSSAMHMVNIPMT